MIKSGYGNKTEILYSDNTVGPPDNSNRNLVIQLDGKQARRIMDIVAFYALPRGSAVTNFEGGRLLVVGTKFSDFSTNIDPRAAYLPPSLSSSQVYLDVMFANCDALDTMGTRFEYHTTKGINLPKGTDASIILTFAYTDNVVAPNSDFVIGGLSVDGYSGGSDAVFKNIR